MRNEPVKPLREYFRPLRSRQVSLLESGLAYSSGKILYSWQFFEAGGDLTQCWPG